MDPSRRKFLLSVLCGAGGVGLRALASGLPAAFLAAPSRARADDLVCHGTEPQHLILITSASGDPLNANVPGCYADPAIYHPADARMAPTAFSVGAVATTAAKPWADLATTAPGLLDRACFFHHATYSNAHGDAAKVNALMGAIKRQELLVSLLARNVAACLGTTQPQPVVLSPNLITYAGAVLPVLTPASLKEVLTAPGGVAGTLRQRRDQDLDRLAALARASGNQAQRTMLDRYALSQAQARALPTDLLADLSSISGSSREDQNTAAAVLIKMNLSPVVVLRYDWGGDNHADGGLAGETTQTLASVSALADLWAKLGKYGLQDRVTVAVQNVFGRTLNAANRGGNANGRDHNAAHHCSVIIGKRIKGSVIGGVAPVHNDFRCEAIRSSTGAADPAGDIPYEATLASAGKTIAAAVGLEAAVLEEYIPAGRVVPAALA